MARGITQIDVWNACDALLLEGARPTIERVRRKIGSGSPNTVSPYLDGWFKHLGARIKDPGVFAAPPELPDPIQQAAKHFWETALAETRLDLDDRLREGLAAAVANVEAEKERAAIADAAAFEAVARASRLQSELAESITLVEQVKLSHATAEAHLSDAKRQIDDLKQQLADVTAGQVQANEQRRLEVAAANERSAGAERRAALEIENERGFRGRAEKRADALEQRVDALISESQASMARQIKDIAELRGEITRHTQDLEVARASLKREHSKSKELAEALAAANLGCERARAEADATRVAIHRLEPLISGRRANKSPSKTAPSGRGT